MDSHQVFSQVYDDYAKLVEALAAFYQGVRMLREFDVFSESLFLYPSNLFISRLVAPGHLLIREAAEDTVLEISKPHGQVGTTTIPVPKGVQAS